MQILIRQAGSVLSYLASATRRRQTLLVQEDNLFLRG